MIRTFKNKNFLLFAAVVGIVGSLSIIAIRRSISRSSIEVQKIQTHIIKNYEKYFETIGAVKPEKEFFLSLKRGGRLDRLEVKAGQIVEQGQIIAAVDESMHRSSLEAALSAFNLSQSELGRVLKLASSNSVSGQDLDIAQNQYAVKKAELEQAKQRLEDGLVRAPVRAVVKSIAFNIGENLPDGARVVVLEDQRWLQIVLDLPEDVVAQIKDSLDIELADLNDNKTEKVAISGVPVQIINPKQQLASSLIRIKLVLGALPEALKDQSSLSVKLILNRYESVREINISDLMVEGDNYYILAADKSGYLNKNLLDIVDKTSSKVYARTFDEHQSEFLKLKDPTKFTAINSSRKLKAKL